MAVALVTQNVMNASQVYYSNAIPATKGTFNGSNKAERFSYKGE